jgi:hypothetical protein
VLALTQTLTLPAPWALTASAKLIVNAAVIFIVASRGGLMAAVNWGSRNVRTEL